MTDAASMQTITLKFRLRDRHSRELSRQTRAVNFVWNYLNETQRKAVTSGRAWLTAFDLQKLTNGSSAELGIHAHTIQRICRVYDDVRKAKKRPWLRWRGKRSLGWVPFNTGHVTFDGAVFKFRGETYAPMHLREVIQAGMKISAGSFNQDARGRWYLNVPVAQAVSPTHDGPSVGVDLGLKDLAVLSDGATVKAPRLYRASEERLATAQRARKTKRAKSIHAKIANRRKDFLHKASAKIAKSYGLVVVGDVSPTKIAKSPFAKSSLDAGWGTLKTMLAYKTIRYGGRMIEVSEAFSSQICSACGSLPSSRPRGIADLGIRDWTCSDCGAAHSRDVNAARNILRSGLATLVEGAGA